MFYLNLKKSKSGHQKMQNPIMLCLKARGIRIAPPGNSYKLYKNKEYFRRLYNSNDLTTYRIQEISMPHSEYALATFYIIQPAEASSNLGRFDGLRYGYHSGGENLQETYERTRGEGFGKEVKRRIMLGSYTLSAGYYDAYYRKALKVRTLIKRDFDEAFKDVDAIVCPTSPTVAWNIGEKFDDPLAMYLEDIFLVPVSLAGLPALSLPCGFNKDTLPIGMQVIGPQLGEERLLQVAACYEGATDWHTRKPSIT